MFRCIAAPKEPEYSTDLAVFGYHKNEKGEFIDNTTGEYFDFFHTDNDRVNDLRRGAYQECLRKEIAAELKEKHGITELFVTGADGTEISSSRPSGQNVSVLTTNVSELAQKRDIIIIVGESGQDRGVWAWRIVQREGGIDGGSLTGLASKVVARVAQPTEGMGRLDQGEQVQTDGQKLEAPGIIVLNPGQLLYSHGLGRNLTVASWQSRPRPTATSEPYKVEPKHNSIPGHETPHKHVQTTFRNILPQIIAEDARLHIIAIGDGTTATIDTIDQIMLIRGHISIGGGVLGTVALLDAKHEHEKIASLLLKRYLASVGKGWVQGEEAKGTVVQMPNRESLGMPALEYAPDAQANVEKPSGATCNGHRTPDAPAVNGHNITNGNHADLVQPLSALAAVDELLSVPGPPPNTPADSGTTSPATVASNPGSPAKSNKVETTIEDADGDYPAPESLPVSCPTYSAGVCDGVTETVLPAVINDVLEHLWFYIQKGQESDAKEAARSEMRGQAWPRDAGDN
ncbi:hypothetical protein CKM354_000209600 [Cercospora kikuchii]|uniref:Arb2 domain-containing protein n=1 Tax=Cercospora kikuchii TaxID=84275 RepID=A0A9P3C962_9PEZI|nr:uncharacterized protein CKM354_000209600 [Cercospora kikuchii]GIZ38689.1 hypothetical protein CKM354_000209600 [Cercospora kikuchii]